MQIVSAEKDGFPTKDEMKSSSLPRGDLSIPSASIFSASTKEFAKISKNVIFLKIKCLCFILNE